MKHKWSLLDVFFIMLLVVVLNACAPAPEPTASPTTVYDCSMVINAGDGWYRVVNALGESDKYLVNGLLRTYNAGVLTPGDVISLPNPASKCNGTRNIAQEVSFNAQAGDLTYEMSGFQDKFSATRIETVLKKACTQRNATLGFGHDEEDLSSGCNYYSAIKYSTTAGGTPTCQEFSSLTAMNDQFVTNDTMMSIEILVTKVTSDQSSPNICTTR